MGLLRSSFKDVSVKLHKTDIVLNLMKKNNIKQFLIDAGFTSELQPLDVYDINGPFKNEFRGQMEKWNAKSAAIFTKAGNKNRRPYDISFEMIRKAVKSVS